MGGYIYRTKQGDMWDYIAWKVYGDEESARKKFALYQKCTRLYCEAYRKHNNLDRLLVRTHGS